VLNDDLLSVLEEIKKTPEGSCEAHCVSMQLANMVLTRQQSD